MIDRYEYRDIKSNIGYVGFEVNFMDLIHFDSALAFNLMHYPYLILPIFNTAVNRLKKLVLSHSSFIELSKKLPNPNSAIRFLDKVFC